MGDIVLSHAMDHQEMSRLDMTTSGLQGTRTKLYQVAGMQTNIGKLAMPVLVQTMTQD